RFELREQLRSPLLWFLAGLFALMGFGAAASDAVQIGGSIGNVYRNAPIVVAQWMTVFTLLGMLIVPIFVSNALLRDFELGTAELFFASPIRRRDYLAGRLAAALSAAIVVYAVVALGIFVAQFMPWIDPARLGPVSLRPYLWALGVMVLPNVVFTCGLMALLAALTRSILWVYIGVLGVFVLYAVSAVLMRVLGCILLATLADPLGIRPVRRERRADARPGQHLAGDHAGAAGHPCVRPHHPLLVRRGAQHRASGARGLPVRQPRAVDRDRAGAVRRDVRGVPDHAYRYR